MLQKNKTNLLRLIFFIFVGYSIVTMEALSFNESILERIRAIINEIKISYSSHKEINEKNQDLTNEMQALSKELTKAPGLRGLLGPCMINFAQASRARFDNNADHAIGHLNTLIFCIENSPKWSQHQLDVWEDIEPSKFLSLSNLKDFITTGMSSTVESPQTSHENDYLLISKGPEEKWRWRNSFKLLFQDFSKTKLLEMNFSKLHEHLSNIRKQVELDASKYMQIETETSNVLVPAITIIYEKKNGELKYISDFLHEYTRNGIAEREYMVFLSGMGNLYVPNEVSTKIGTFRPTKGDSLPGMSETQMKESLKILYQTSLNTADPLNHFKEFIQKIVINPPDTKYANFGTYFYHSEQWFIYHLSSAIPGTFRFKFTGNNKPLPYGNLCLSIINALNATGDINDIKSIHEIIFHAESTHDICDVCSPTLAVFIEHLNNEKSQIIPLLKQIAQVQLKKNDLEVSEHLRFFMITSSSHSDLGQSGLREYYINNFNNYKGYRRVYFGKDKITDQDKPIEITPQIPYLYVQVPVNDQGIPVKSIEKK